MIYSPVPTYCTTQFFTLCNCPRLLSPSGLLSHAFSSQGTTPCLDTNSSTVIRVLVFGLRRTPSSSKCLDLYMAMQVYSSPRRRRQQLMVTKVQQRSGQIVSVLVSICEDLMVLRRDDGSSQFRVIANSVQNLVRSCVSSSWSLRISGLLLKWRSLIEYSRPSVRLFIMQNSQITELAPAIASIHYPWEGGLQEIFCPPGWALCAQSINIIKTMSESDSDSSKEQKKSPKAIVKQRSRRSPIERENSFKPPPPPPPPQPIPDQTGLYQENRKLRRKLKELSMRLDEELEKAAENKLKQNNHKNGHPVSLESQNMQLQNAYKMIERLQKTVREYESKQSYQITLKRVMDLESIIKKKEGELEEMKTEIKTLKKMGKDKDKRIDELIENTKKMGNPAEDKELINKLKAKLKKVLEENDMLRKKELEKHGKLVQAQRKIVEMEQQEEMPIGKEESLLQDVEEWKKKYKEAMQRVERQNIYISKLNEKLTKEGNQKSRRSERLSEKYTEKAERRTVARSMEDLPSLQKKINTSQLLEHLPSPKQGPKLRRY